MELQKRIELARTIININKDRRRKINYELLAKQFDVNLEELKKIGEKIINFINGEKTEHN